MPLSRISTLCIPTAFCSYGGEALDKKTPLLRSMEALSRQALRVLRLFGNTEAKRVFTTVGPEQEYFLIDQDAVRQAAGPHALQGARCSAHSTPKGQELEDHYFGAIKPRVTAFMEDLNEELWKLGVLAKTEHNEVAPAQHELAPIFTTTNIATDHNQLTMEIMKKVAAQHGLVCLLHEKPFDGVNGSGKHNNWSLCTDTGDKPAGARATPRTKTRSSCCFLAAVIKAVDEYQDLLRISVASCRQRPPPGRQRSAPGHHLHVLGRRADRRSGGYRDRTAPTATRSKSKMEHGRGCAAQLYPKDTTDRNRTSPFAFTGNKFEFRMLGSSLTYRLPQLSCLNTVVAEELTQFADQLGESELTLKLDAA